MLRQVRESFARYCTDQTRLYLVCCGQHIDGVEWMLSKGVLVRYLLVPSPLQVAMPFHPALDCRVFNGPVERMQTFHFAYTEIPDMMWVERFHPADSLRAEDCEFLPPSLAQGDPRLPNLKGLFTKAWNRGLPVTAKE